MSDLYSKFSEYYVLEVNITNVTTIEQVGDMNCEKLYPKYSVVHVISWNSENNKASVQDKLNFLAMNVSAAISFTTNVSESPKTDLNAPENLKLNFFEKLFSGSKIYFLKNYIINIIQTTRWPRNRIRNRCTGPWGDYRR